MTTAAVLMSARRDMAESEPDERYSNLCFHREFSIEETVNEPATMPQNRAKRDHCWLCRDFIVKKPQPSFQTLAHS